MKCPACNFEINKKDETREIENGRGEKQTWHETCHRAYILGFTEGVALERTRTSLARGQLNRTGH